MSLIKKLLLDVIINPVVNTVEYIGFTILHPIDSMENTKFHIIYAAYDIYDTIHDTIKSRPKDYYHEIDN